MDPAVMDRSDPPNLPIVAHQRFESRYPSYAAAALRTEMWWGTVPHHISVLMAASRRITLSKRFQKTAFVIFHHLKWATEPHFAPAAVRSCTVLVVELAAGLAFVEL